MKSIISIENVSKIYKGGFQALKNVNLEIKQGEIFALLGPNGAGKTTLISLICGIANMTSGRIFVDSYDIIKDYRQTRSRIGLVPQELTMDVFETVWDTTCFSRELFGKAKNPDYIKDLLKTLSLDDKRNNKLLALSGGMKRRVMIAKALSHEPRVLFLDEPTAGVDVELRKAMWDQVHKLRESGVTIILTTHYIEEAEEMADRVGVIRNGEIILVEEKSALMKKLGQKQLTLDLQDPLQKIPDALQSYKLDLSSDKLGLTYSYECNSKKHNVQEFLNKMNETQIAYKDIHTRQSSLEDIFVGLVKK